jgi:pyruvate/2-oxoglutarate dehydrogenase complex dihydrolipoamide dehydrogenase (E3) component
MMPERLRTLIVQRFLGPAPCWFVREEIEGRVTVMGGSRIIDARETAHGVKLEIASGGGTRTLEADHVIAGTGFRVNAARLQFLDTAIASALELTQDAPKLSSNFESTVAGLYFVGTMAAYEFGPMLRFVCGADFTARRVANHIAGAARPVTRKAEDYRSLEMSPARQRLPLELE